MNSEPFKPYAAWSPSPEVDHVIPNDDYPHIRLANTCPCGPLVIGLTVRHNRHRQYTEAEKERIRAGDAYDPEDSDVSDEIIARGTFDTKFSVPV